MRYSLLKSLFLFFVIILTILAVDRYLMNKKIRELSQSFIEKPLVLVYAFLEDSRFFVGNIIRIKKLSDENIRLAGENKRLIQRTADYDNVVEENNFLRKTLNFSSHFKNIITDASIYQLQAGVAGYDVLINKGSQNGVLAGDVIIAEDGILVGKILETAASFSKILIVSDPRFQIAGKILGSGTAGIAKGAMVQGITFELITQEDAVSEGDYVVSSGIDFIPPALIIGIVSYVGSNETDLFKQVRIKPAMEDTKISRVLVIRP